MLLEKDTIKSLFLIVANARTGSTWLETLLGSLPDTYADREFKWKPSYKPQPIHVAIPDERFSCKQALMSLSLSHAIVGSKLIFDPRVHTDDEYNKIRRTIENDLPIIHLYRAYEQVIVSWTRSMGPLALPGKDIHNSADSLRDAIMHEGRRDTSKNITPRLGAILNMMTDSDKEKVQEYFERGKLWFPHYALHKMVMALFMNDLFIYSLSNKCPYIAIQYSEIKDRFKEVVAFIESSASEGETNRVLNLEITRKVMTEKITDIVVNYDEFHSVCSLYDEALKLILAARTK